MPPPFPKALVLRPGNAKPLKNSLAVLKRNSSQPQSHPVSNLPLPHSILMVRPLEDSRCVFAPASSFWRTNDHPYTLSLQLPPPEIQSTTTSLHIKFIIEIL